MDLWKKIPPKARAFALVLIVIVVGVAAAVTASQPTCSRQVVSGRLAGDADFSAREATVYSDRTFPGNPLVVRVEGNISASRWYEVRLPGVRVPEQLRIYAQGATVTGYYLTGDTLNFYALMKNDTPAARVDILYIAGSVSWDGHFELDLDANVLALVARVSWGASAMFRGIDLLLVSGEVHTVPNAAGPPAATSAGGFGPGLRWDSSTERDPLAAFEVPSSTDTGIFVVHRVKDIDIPGSNAAGRPACEPRAFFMRVYESPVATQKMVVVGATSYASTGEASRLPLLIELRNVGGLPWMPGRADLYQDGILAGADTIPYTARNGTVRLELGKALDLTVTRSLSTAGGSRFTNYTARNLDVTPYSVEIHDLYRGENISDPGAFQQQGLDLVALVVVPAGAHVTVGWMASS